jgi:mannose-6-phosphate isomerase
MKKEQSLDWLRKLSIPLWLERGLDARVGGFVENLSWRGEPMLGPRRCMVQARQIFSFRAAIALGVVEERTASAAMRSGLELLLSRFSLPSGAFRHAIDESGDPHDESAGLYGQAFALFGLAEGYALFREETMRERAKALLAYLRRERKAKGGGYTEIEAGKVVYRSNPHMHLFEAALAWIEIDRSEPLADELLELCVSRFVDSATGLLGENFLEGWERERSPDGRFHWEPGHHCEWSWLLGRYQELLGRDLSGLRVRLYELAEKHGRDPSRAGVLIDQCWSDFSPKLRSARFWPQCERIKAASQLRRREAAREAMSALFRYFETPVAGLWYDTWEQDGVFREQPVKASSLYHIIGAIKEYEPG